MERDAERKFAVLLKKDLKIPYRGIIMEINPKYPKGVFERGCLNEPAARIFTTAQRNHRMRLSL